MQNFKYERRVFKHSERLRGGLRDNKNFYLNATEWLASPGGTKFSKLMKEMSKELNVFLTSFYTSARKKDLINSFLCSPPFEKPFSIISDPAFTEANKLYFLSKSSWRRAALLAYSISNQFPLRVDEETTCIFDSGELGPGTRSSKVPETFRFRACRAIFSSSVSKSGDVYTTETSCMKKNSVRIKNMWIKQLCNDKARDDVMALRAWSFRGFGETDSWPELAAVEHAVSSSAQVSGLFKSLFLDTNKLKMDFQAQKVSGAFKNCPPPPPTPPPQKNHRRVALEILKINPTLKYLMFLTLKWPAISSTIQL